MAGKRARAAPRTLSRGERILQIAMASLGGLILLGTLAVVIVSAAGPATPPAFEVEETARRTVGDRIVLDLTVKNTGDRTAAAVEIEAAAANGDTGSVTLDYVPGNSRKPASVSLSAEVGASPVELAAVGWTRP